MLPLMKSVAKKLTLEMAVTKLDSVKREKTFTLSIQVVISVLKQNERSGGLPFNPKFDYHYDYRQLLP